MTGGEFPPGMMWLEDEAGKIFQGKASLVETDLFAKLVKTARTPGLAPPMWTMPIQYPTMEAMTRAFASAGRAAGKAAAMLRTLNHAMGLRSVRPVPPAVPAGLSRVDSARRRSARTALLRERRRALRHNRRHQPSRSRARIAISDPKTDRIERELRDFRPYRDRREDRLDATLFAYLPRP